MTQVSAEAGRTEDTGLVFFLQLSLVLKIKVSKDSKSYTDSYT